MKKYGYALLCFLGLWLAGCAGIPEGVKPVSGFDVNRYLGKWYEIVRLDHPFERDLEQVTAEYSLREDGDIRVINRGFNIAGQKWQEAEGRAKFVGSPDVGRLKVSFFGPFYGGYNIVELDPGYQYVMIVGNDRDYLWILSRTPQLAPEIQQRLVAKARSLGFATDKLIYVKQ
ncbi:MAG: lipocalin family protein [Thiolinea sp.]